MSMRCFWPMTKIAGICSPSAFINVKVEWPETCTGYFNIYPTIMFWLKSCTEIWELFILFCCHFWAQGQCVHFFQFRSLGFKAGTSSFWIFRLAYFLFEPFMPGWVKALQGSMDAWKVDVALATKPWYKSYIIVFCCYFYFVSQTEGNKL